MRSLLFAMAVLGGIACVPGSGEYGSCGTTPECQLNLQCISQTDTFSALPDGGFIQDGGWCRYPCAINTDCSTYGELCGVGANGTGYCSKDGGFFF